jgi:hypothetical protein
MISIKDIKNKFIGKNRYFENYTTSKFHHVYFPAFWFSNNQFYFFLMLETDVSESQQNLMNIRCRSQHVRVKTESIFELGSFSLKHQIFHYSPDDLG